MFGSGVRHHDKGEITQEWYEVPGALPETDSKADYLCFVFKRYEYLTFAFTERDGTDLHAFTVHQVDAKRMIKALSEAILDPVDASFSLRLLGGAEGVYKGGPPRKDQLVEFRNKDVE